MYAAALGYICLTALTLLCVAICAAGVAMIITKFIDWFRDV